MPKTAPEHTVASHFAGRAPEVLASYRAILKAARAFGPVSEEAKKTSIHLVRRTVFAGVATRKDALVLTLKSDSDIEHPRISKHEQASAHRWHLETRIERPGQVDAELVRWLKAAYAMAE